MTLTTTRADTREAANYGRQSHGKRKSVREQISLGKAALIMELGYDESEIREYRDTVSASRFTNAVRRGWEQILEDIEAGEIGVVVVWEASRGDRKLTTWSGFLDLCALHGVLIYSISAERTYDVRKPQDWKELATDGIDSVLEVAKTSQRVSRGVFASATEGKPHGRVPFGYRRLYQEGTGEYIGQIPDMRTYVTDSGHEYKPAEVVREVFNWLAGDLGALEIARRLNDLGIPSPLRFAALNRGDEEMQEKCAHMVWEPQVVTNMARKVGYIGTRVHKKRVAKLNAWESLISEATFWEVQTVVSNPARRTNKGGTQARWFLSCIARCYCGGTMTPVDRKWNGKSYASYRCSKDGAFTDDRKHASMAVRKLDSFVETVVLGFLVDPRSIAQMQSNVGRDKEAAKAQARADELEAEMTAARESALDKKKPWITWADFERAAEELHPQIEKLREQAKYTGVPADVMDMTGEEAVLKWRDASMVKRRRVVRSLFMVTVRASETSKHVPAEDRVLITPSF